MCAFFNRSLKETSHSPNLSSNMTPKQTMSQQDTMCTLTYQMSSCPENLMQSSFVYHSVPSSSTLRKGSTLKRKPTTLVQNSSTKKKILQTAYKRHVYSNLLKDSFVGRPKSCALCPYNLRYRILTG